MTSLTFNIITSTTRSLLRLSEGRQDSFLLLFSGLTFTALTRLRISLIGVQMSVFDRVFTITEVFMPRTCRKQLHIGHSSRRDGYSCIYDG